NRASMSAGIRARKSGQETDPLGGLHRFLIVDDGLQIETVVATLGARLMLAGYLWGKVSENGRILPRTLIDLGASSDMSRLWYEGLAGLEDADLEYVPERRAV